MKRITLLYLEVMNQTEQLYVFGIMHDKEQYGTSIIMNTALPIPMQDELFTKFLVQLSGATLDDMKKATLI